MTVIRPYAVQDKDVFNLLQALVNALLDYANLRTGTTTTRVQVSAFRYRIGSRFYAKAAEDNIQVTGLTNTPAAITRKVRVEINTAGTVSFKEGAAAAAQANAPLPRRTASRATIGWIEIPASFTYDTTAFSAAGVTIRDGDPDLGDGASLPPGDRGIDQTIVNAP